MEAFIKARKVETADLNARSIMCSMPDSTS
jgi:hypothetical protein